MPSSDKDPQAPSVVSAGIAKVNVNGTPLLFHVPNDLVAWRIRTLLTKEPHTIAWLNRMPEGALMFDVGANIGLYSLYAAMMRGVKVFAFEPEASNFALLARNIIINDAHHKVIAYPAAMSDRIELGRLFLNDPRPGGSGHSCGESVDYRLAPRTATAWHGCIAMTLDSVVFDHTLPIPDFIKIDVDGLEYLVLSGGRRLLHESAVREVLIELNLDLPAHQNADRLLREAGFTYDAEQANGARRADGPFQGFAEIIYSRIR